MKTNLNGAYPSVDPGQFRHQIFLLEQVTTTDVSGSVTQYQVGEPPVSAWAELDYIRGAELIKAGQDVTQTFLKVTSWWRPEFEANTKIVVPSGKHYIIQFVENVQEMSIYMVLMCKAIGIGA